MKTKAKRNTREDRYYLFYLLNLQNLSSLIVTVKNKLSYSRPKPVCVLLFYSCFWNKDPLGGEIQGSPDPFSLPIQSCCSEQIKPPSLSQVEQIEDLVINSHKPELSTIGLSLY